MRLLVVVVGLILIAVGLFLAFGEFGSDRAKGGGGKFSLEGPSWLLLVAIGVGVVIFGASQDFDDRGGDGVTSTADSPPSTADSPPSTAGASPDESSTSVADATSSTTSSPEPVSGCQVTIANRLASYHVEPDLFSTEVGRIPSGTYQVIETEEVTFVDQIQRWFLIEVDGQAGWVHDTTFDIESKTAECF